MSGYPPPPPPPPPPGYGSQPGYGGTPPPGYGAPPPGYGAPPPGYGAPPPGYGVPPGPYRPSWAPSPAPSRTSPVRIVVLFVGVLVFIAIVAAAFVAFTAPEPPVAPCAAGVPCAPKPTLGPVTSPGPGVTPRPGSTPAPGSTPVPGSTLPPAGTPTGDSPPVLTGTLYTDDSLGYSFEYDPDYFTLGKTGAGTAVLNGDSIDAVVWVDAMSADTAPAKLIESKLSDVDGIVIARETDSDTYDAVLGPSIGYVPGQGGVWAGTLTSSDGTPVEPVGVTVVAATDGRITVAVTVIVGSPDHLLSSDDTRQHAVRSLVDDILKTFTWSAQ